jgi:hypothetical protein
MHYEYLKTNCSGKNLDPTEEEEEEEKKKVTYRRIS